MTEAEIHQKILEQWIEDYGSLDREQSMDAYTVSGFMKEAMRDSLKDGWVSVEAEKILLIRDALVAKDYNEAFHILYSIASPNFDKHDPWEEVERIADSAKIKPKTKQELEDRTGDKDNSSPPKQ